MSVVNSTFLSYNNLPVFEVMLIVKHGMSCLFQITEVDDVLLKFKNLTDLTLTANLIQNIDLRIIPKTIEVYFDGNITLKCCI